MQRSGEKAEKLTFTRDGKNIYGVVTAKHRKGQPFNFAKLKEQPPPLLEQPPSIEEQRLPPRRSLPRSPPPSPKGRPGPNP